MGLHVLLAIDTAGWCFHNIANQKISRLAVGHSYKLMPHLRVAREKADLVVNYWWGSTARMRTNVRAQGHILCVYDGLSWCVNEDSKRKFLLACKQADVLAVCNQRFMRELTETFGDVLPPMYLIEDGVDLDIFKELPLPEDGVHFGWTGNSQRRTPGGPPDQKGLNLLRKAKNLSGCSVRILDASKGHAWKLEDMPRFYKEISVMCCFGFVEGTPNPLLEALACGRPVLCTHSPRSPQGPGLAEQLIKPGHNGWLVERSAGAIAEAMQEISQLPPHRLREMGQKAVESVQSYGWDKKIAQWKTVFTGALRQGAVRGNPPAKKGHSTAVEPMKIETLSPMKIEILSDNRKAPQFGFDRPIRELEEMQGVIVSDKDIYAAGLSCSSMKADAPLIYTLSGWRFFSRTYEIMKRTGNAFNYRSFVLGHGRRQAIPEAGPKPSLLWSCYPYQDALAALRYKEKHGTPYVITLRGAFWNVTPELSKIALETLEGADAIISLTETLQEEINSHWPSLAQKRWETIPNGFSQLRPPQEGVSLPIDLPRPLLLTVGNFSFPAKLRPARLLLDKLDDAGFQGTYLMAGAGNLLPVGPIGRCGWYLGFSANVAALLTQADIFVYPSEQDSQPTALLEAMSYGLPCIVQTARGVGSAETCGADTALLYSRPEEAVQHVERLLDSRSLAKELGDKAKSYVEQAFSWEKCAKAHTRLFRSLI